MDTTRIHTRAFETICDGLRIRGTWSAPEGGRRLPAVAVLHGIPRAKPVPGDSSYRKICEELAGRGLVAAALNFRGTGLSEGDISAAGWTRDLYSTLDYLSGLDEVDPSRIAALGFSAGGSVAIRAAADDPRIKAVAAGGSPADYSFLQSAMPASGWVKLFREIGLIRDPGFPRDVEAWEREFEEISPLRWADRLSPRPLLVFHGEDDELIPVEHARKIYERAGEPREFALVKSGRHRLRVEPAALSIAFEWLDRWRLSG